MINPGRRSRVAAATLVGVLVALAGCGGSRDAGRAGEGPEGSLQVFAAASLIEPFTEIGTLFEAEHGVSIEFNFAGSADLAAQIQQGAPADVFVSADVTTMHRLEETGSVAGSSQIFAANTLVIVTPPNNPADIHSLQDLAGDAVVTVVCAPQVPCGAAAYEIAEREAVELTPASEENVVTDVLGKVLSGEADAGLVYRTDALRAGEGVETVEVDRAEEVPNHYAAAVMEEAADPEAAADFVDFVLDSDAQGVLSDAGFATP